MKAKLLLVLALACALIGAGIVVAARGPANMTPDDELRFFFLLLNAAVLLSAAFIVAAVQELRAAIAGVSKAAARAD